MSEATEQENKRDEKGRFISGVSGNPGGRPKNSLKDYIKIKLADMTEKEKEEWLKGIPKDMQWKMAEGNPHQTAESKVEVILPKPILDVQENTSNKEDNSTE